MSRIVAKLLMSISLPPLALVTFVAALIYCERFDEPISYAAGMMLLVLYSCWFLVWRSAVRWTPQRIGRTFLALTGSLMTGLLVGLSLGKALAHGSFAEEAAIIFGSIGAAIAWMFATALVWRETAGERTSRFTEAANGTRPATRELKCPGCGYLMNGLTHARCPECGAEYTIESLVAASYEASRPEAELEQ